MRNLGVLVLLGCSLALACGDKDGMGDGGSGSGGSGSGEGTEAGTGSGEGGGNAECHEDDFGTVMIELQRSAAEPQSPFVGTARIVVFLDYEECLASFYTQDHPEYQQDGVEGAPVFAAWTGGCLCDTSYAKPTIPCSVDSMTQTIVTEGATDTTFLRIDYLLSSDDIEGLNIPFGPLPVEAFAGCTPLVRLTGASVQGFDAQDQQIWKIASFDDPVARVGQGASIQVFIERSN